MSFCKSPLAASEERRPESPPPAQAACAGAFPEPTDVSDHGTLRSVAPQLGEPSQAAAAVSTESTGHGPLPWHSLPRGLDAVARTSHLLVGCDYDGTLAELVVNPARALPAARVLDSLRCLGGMAHTTIAVVSGRSLLSLNEFLGKGGPEIKIGSHGAEWSSPGVVLNAEQRSLLGQLAAAATSLVSERRGLRCEVKPAGIALHFRGADRRLAEIAVAAAVATFGSLPGVLVRRGSEVIEFMVVPANKGEAVLRLKGKTCASGVLFLGDDLTDEDVFKVLGDRDAGVHVGNGPTHAPYRVANVEQVGALLTAIATVRRAWLEGGGGT